MGSTALTYLLHPDKDLCCPFASSSLGKPESLGESLSAHWVSEYFYASHHLIGSFLGHEDFVRAELGSYSLHNSRRGLAEVFAPGRHALETGRKSLGVVPHVPPESRPYGRGPRSGPVREDVCMAKFGARYYRSPVASGAGNRGEAWCDDLLGEVRILRSGKRQAGNLPL